MDVAIDWNNYDVTFQVYSLYEVTTTKTSWSRETVAISSITGQKNQIPQQSIVSTKSGENVTG
ncbi:MAG: hypothetical protein ACJASB_002590 [Shewanella psychromarinicola]|jgi:hypothetical protein